MPVNLIDTSGDPFEKCKTCIHNYKAGPMWWSCRKEYEGFTYHKGCESREERNNDGHDAPRTKE